MEILSAEVHSHIAIGRRKRSKWHGASVDYRPEHLVWFNMLARCYNPEIPAYGNYGGRGITVCERWRNSFLAFLEDMGKRPAPRHTIERIDNDLGYSPENCTWATWKQQSRNGRRNRLITFCGRTKCLTDWATEIGISYQTLSFRLKHWDLDKALTTPKLQ
jgi:hypothetical protein